MGRGFHQPPTPFPLCTTVGGEGDMNLHVRPRVNLQCSQITRRSQGWFKFSSDFSFVNNQWKLNGFVNVPVAL